MVGSERCGASLWGRVRGEGLLQDCACGQHPCRFAAAAAAAAAAATLLVLPELCFPA
jgi:hypothetical protein